MKQHGLLFTFFRYLISGGLATAVHFTVLIVLIDTQLSSPLHATMFGAGAGFLVNYQIQFHWTFKATGSHKLIFTRYLVISSIMFGLNTGIFWLATMPECLIVLKSIPFPTQLTQPENIVYWYAQIIATGVVFLCNFLINHHYTFKTVQSEVVR